MNTVVRRELAGALGLAVGGQEISARGQKAEVTMGVGIVRVFGQTRTASRRGTHPVALVQQRLNLSKLDRFRR